jgi:hypothetical protein
MDMKPFSKNLKICAMHVGPMKTIPLKQLKDELRAESKLDQ